MSDEFTVGREPIQIVEIEQPACAESYSVSPCTAALTTTGSRKCFNTANTCQDRPNYDPSFTIFWRFAKPAAVLPRDLYSESAGVNFKTNPIPSLLSVSSTPARINIGGGSKNSKPLGRRATVSITLKDIPWDDSVGDFYVTERPTGAAGDVYTPIERGTFWTKWLARNPFRAGYVVKVYEGYKGQALGSMQVRQYVLEKVNGPSNDRVTIVAKDPLRLADNERAQFPTVSDITLVGAISDIEVATVEVASLETEINSDFGNTGSTRYIRIGDEILQYTGYGASGAGEWTFTGVTRGVLGTTAAAHSANDKCQRVGRYSALEVWEIAEDLLTNHTNVDASFIPSADWDTEGNSFLSPFVLTGTVAAPVPVETLLGELTEQCPFYMWWDEREQEIPIRAIRPPMADGVQTLNDESGFIRDSVKLKEDQRQRISRVFLYYNQIDPTKPLRDTGNYRSVRGRIDGDAESDDEYGEVRLRQIFSRWLTSSAQAIQTTTRLLARFRNAVGTLTGKVDAKDRAINTADVLDVTTRSVVDDTGESVPRRWQAIARTEVVPGEIILLEMQRFEYLGRFAVWADEAMVDYSAATDTQKENNAFYSDADGSPGTDDGVDAFGYQYV
jgi:hypothetical protein